MTTTASGCRLTKTAGRSRSERSAINLTLDQHQFSSLIDAAMVGPVKCSAFQAIRFSWN